MEAICEVCGEAVATIKCSDCIKNSLLCSECYSFSHKSDIKKAHRTKQVTPGDTAKQTNLPDGTTVKEKYNAFPCAKHNESRKYICTCCEMAICSDCLLIGEHKGHDAIRFEELEKHMHEVYGGTVKEYAQLLERLQEIKVTAQMKTKKAHASLCDIKEDIEKNFNEIEKALRDQKLELYAFLDSEFSKITIPSKEIDEALGDCEGKVKSIKNLLEISIKSITPDNYDKSAKIKIESCADLKERVECLEKVINEAKDSIPLAKFDISNMKSQINSSISLSFFKEFNFASIKKWKVINYNPLKGSSCRGLAYDVVTKYCYCVEGCSPKEVVVYRSIDHFMKKESERVIALESQCDGTFVIARKGFLYYPICNSGQVAKMDLATGKVITTLLLPNAARHCGGGNFNGCSYTDIALLLDPITQSVYIMYQDLITGQCKISLVIEAAPSVISLGQTWVLPGEEKKEIGFAFVSKGHVYMGSKYDKPVIDLDFDMSANAWGIKPNIQLPKDIVDIRHIMLTDDGLLIVCDYNKGVFCVRSARP